MAYRRRKFIRRRRFRNRRMIKRNYKRKRYYKTRSAMIKLNSPFPPQLFARCRYVETISLDGNGSQVSESAAYRANSIYDPTRTGAGHQPLGYDEMSLLYDYYTVLGSRIKCQFMNSGAENMWVGVNLTDVGTHDYTVNPIQWVEQDCSPKKVKSLVLAPDQQKTIVMNFSTKKFFGIRDLSGYGFATPFDTNPLRSAYFQVWASGVVGESPNCRVIVTLEFIVKCTSRKFLAQSDTVMPTGNTGHLGPSYPWNEGYTPL